MPLSTFLFVIFVAFCKTSSVTLRNSLHRRLSMRAVQSAGIAARCQPGGASGRNIRGDTVFGLGAL